MSKLIELIDYDQQENEYARRDFFVNTERSYTIWRRHG